MKDPAFLFYPNDWIGGTLGMTFEEKGAYMELLMMQFNRGHMTERMIGQTVGQLWVNIKDKFKVDDNGMYYNERLETEKEKRKAFTESRRNNINGKNQYSKKTGHKDGHTTKRMENENENVIEDVNELLFIIEEIYNKYPSKCPVKSRSTGKSSKDKDKISRLLKTNSKEHLLLTIETYVNDCIKSKTYLKNFATFLNNLPDIKEDSKPVLRNQDKTNADLFGQA